MQTYEQLMAMARDGDPLIDPDRPDSASITPEGLLILGSQEDGYQSDMLIRIEPDGSLRAWWRDPAGELVIHGPTWADEQCFRRYEDLVSSAYQW